MRRQAYNDGWTFWKKGQEQKKTTVTLPHDAMIHEKRNPDCKSGSAGAFFPGGVYCYEKTVRPEDLRTCRGISAAAGTSADGGNGSSEMTAGQKNSADGDQRHVLLHFGGVYRNASVEVNGEQVLQHAYGYTPFDVDLSSFLRDGQPASVRVTADNADVPNSRWYSGSGIYRPVTLVTGPEMGCIVWQSLRVSTLELSPAKIRVEADVTEGADEVLCEIREPESGRIVSAHRLEPGRNESMNINIIENADKSTRSDSKKPEMSDHLSAELTLPVAKLWDGENPFLYTCRLTTKKDGKILDEDETAFGIRRISWNRNGFFVNGKQTLLRGGCIHHDSGILGAATFAEMEDRKVRKLKEAGFNAIRSAHNPASEELLTACDRYGVYVMDEAWDMWYRKKNAYDYARDFEENWQADLQTMVKNDFNHPSVVMYSIGNEVSEPAHQRGIDLAKAMTDYVHGMDSSRAVTAGMNLMIIANSAKGKDLYGENGREDDGKAKKMSGMNSTMFNMITQMVGTGMNKAANSKRADKAISPVLDTLDIAGYNYASGRYPLDAKLHPDRVIMGSETFPQDIWKNWQMVKKYPQLIGDFMWTAWDYLGEAGIGGWAYTEDGKGFDKPYPWLAGEVGVLDLLGNPNGELYQAQAAWGLLKRPVICVQPVNHPEVKPAKSVWRGTNSIPSWSWSGCEGNAAVVEVYAPPSVVSIELHLNGMKLGRKRVKCRKTVFKVKYRPGKLEAFALDGQGKRLEPGESLMSAGASSVQIASEKTSVCPGEVFCVDVRIADNNGIIECNADRKVKVSVSGGEILAFGSANPRTEERYDSGMFTTYYGRTMAVVHAGNDGIVTVTAEDQSGQMSVKVPVRQK